jgi:phosphohistidine phosphatase SixA
VSAIHLIRHAKAKNRARWSEDDELRPLTKRGRREALALAERLAGEPLGRLVSSPFARCVQTLEPLALTADLPIETTELLAEGAAGSSAAALLLSLADEQPLACCTHGDVMHEIVRAVAERGLDLAGPAEAPVASTWVLDVAEGAFTGGRFVAPPPY